MQITHIQCKKYTLWARFTNSLHQHKPSFGIKIVLSGFTKDTQWRISAEKVWKGIFAPDLIEYAFVGVSHSEVLIWRRVLIWITQRDLLTFALYKLL